MIAFAKSLAKRAIRGRTLAYPVFGYLGVIDYEGVMAKCAGRNTMNPGGAAQDNEFEHKNHTVLERWQNHEEDAQYSPVGCIAHQCNGNCVCKHPGRSRIEGSQLPEVPWRSLGHF